MYIDDSYQLYERLEALDLLKTSPEFWWPNYGSVEVVIGAILTQNTKWSKVEVSLENLHRVDGVNLEFLATSDLAYLQELIKPSGLYKTKAKYLKTLAQNILEDFGDFEMFCESVSREYLLSQKGIGFESADAILCYACQRDDVMVVDAYSARLMQALGYEFEEYHDLQAWFTSGCKYDEGMFARYHGMIVEYCKVNSKGKMVTIESLINKD